MNFKSIAGQDDRRGEPDPLPLENATPVSDEGPRGEELRRSLRLVTMAWLFGSIWMTATSGAPMTLFAQSLGATKFQFGLLSALPFIASLLSLPASLLTDRTGQRKRIFLWGLYTQRLLWFPIALVPFVLVTRYGDSGYRPAMTAFLLLVFMMHCGQAFGGPAWVSWMADIVPDRSRGRYFSRRRQYGLLTAIPTAILTGWVLDQLRSGGHTGDSLNMMQWCGIVFMAAALFGLIDIALQQWVPRVDAPPQRHSLVGIVSKPLRDPQFLWFAGYVATLVFAISFMGQFVTLYLIEKLHVTNTQTQLMLLVAPAIAQLLVFSAWGRAVDRMGKKPVLALGSLGLVPVGLGWCFMNGGAIWLGYLLSAAGAALWAGVEVANFNLVIEMAGSDDENGGGGTSYVAINGVIINIAGCMGGLCSGLIAQSLRNWTWDIGILGLAPIGFYEVLFALSGILRFLAVVVFLPRIHEPHARPAHETLRFMTANIYNNLFNAVLQPIRFAMIKARTTYEQALGPEQ